MSIVGLSFVERIKMQCAGFAGLVIPPQCLLCDAILEAPGGCCSKCWQSVRFISRPFCEVLGTPFSHDLGKGALCAEAIANPPPFRRLRSAVLYDDQMRRLVSGLKYSDRLELAPWMAGWMETAGGELLEDDCILVPVPLYAGRLLSRRYNQSAEFARHLAKRTGLEYRPDALIRVRNTKQQVGLTARERERNVQGAFQVPLSVKPEIAGRNIILIDDVYTTGATAKAATRGLKRGGSGAVDVLTFARVETFDL